MVTQCFGARSLGFGVEAFNSAVPAEAKNSLVFSPLSFEFDSVIMADAYEPITKAHIAETLGVLSDLVVTYEPLMRYYNETAATNHITFLSARAFLVPDYDKVSAAYRQETQRNYGAEVAIRFPPQGPQTWFRTKLDGMFEDFELPPNVAAMEVNSFYDVLYVSVEAEGEKVTGKVTPYAKFDLEKIPLQGEAELYIARPKEGVSLAELRNEISEANIDELVNVVGESKVLTVPYISLTSNLNIARPMQKFQFPTSGYLRLNGGLKGREFHQYCRFRLNGRKSKAAMVFFVYHRPTNSILVMGQTTGK